MPVQLQLSPVCPFCRLQLMLVENRVDFKVGLFEMQVVTPI
jgi:hypothetical protein